MGLDTVTPERIEEALDHVRYFTQEEYPEVIYLDSPIAKRRGKRIRRSCPNCGKFYYLRPCDVVRRKYCSNECFSEFQKTENRAKRLLTKCPICGKGMDFTSSTRRKYCSKECLKLADKRKPRSEKRLFRCSKLWVRIRKERISDFGHICPITLKSDKTHSIQVHHIDSDYSNNESENLIPLWASLHRLITARAEVSPFYEARDRAILSSITKAWKD